MNRKLTIHQIELLAQLVAFNGNLVLVHSYGRQDMRTARSLARKFNITVKRETKMEGAKFSYGYRAIRVTAPGATLANIQALLSNVYDRHVSYGEVLS